MVQETKNNSESSFKLTVVLKEMPFSVNSPPVPVPFHLENLNLGEMLVGDTTIPPARGIEWRSIQPEPGIENARAIAYLLIHMPGSLETLLFLDENTVSTVDDLAKELQLDEKIVEIIARMHDLDLINLKHNRLELTPSGKNVLSKLRSHI